MIDTATNTVSRRTIPVGAAPVAVRSPRRRCQPAYVTNAGGDTVSVIDTATNTVNATIPVGDRPSAVAVNPDGTLAYVANSRRRTPCR